MSMNSALWKKHLCPFNQHWKTKLHRKRSSPLKSLLLPVERTTDSCMEYMWPTSHPHSVTENKLVWNGGWLALQIIFLTQIIKYFLHRPGTKRRRCKKWWFMLLLCYLKWRKLISQERDRGMVLCLSPETMSQQRTTWPPTGLAAGTTTKSSPC